MNELPTLGENLTPESNTRDVLAWLCEAYASKGPDFSRARLILEEWADGLSQANVRQDTFPLLSATQQVTMRGLLEAMEREQAARFLGELFTDVVPHVHSKRQLLQDIEQEKTSSGMRVRRSRLLGPVFQAMGSAAAGLVGTQAHVLNLTWKDDGRNYIQSNVSVGMEVEGDTASSPGAPRKGMPFLLPGLPLLLLHSLHLESSSPYDAPSLRPLPWPQPRIPGHP